MGHGGGAFLALGEEFLGLQNLSALQVAYFSRKALYRAGKNGERGKESGMTIPRDYLGGNRLRLQAKFFRYIFFYARIDIGECADSAGNLAGGDLITRTFQLRALAFERVDVAKPAASR